MAEISTGVAVNNSEDLEGCVSPQSPVAETASVDTECSEDYFSQQMPISSSIYDDDDIEEGRISFKDCYSVSSDDVHGSFNDCSSDSSVDIGVEALISLREDLNRDWVSSIRENLLSEPTKLKADQSCSIHRVPRWLRTYNKHGYDPQFISIGPFHYNKRARQLRAMEEHKWRYLRDIVNRKPKNWLEDCLATVKALEGRARNYYSEEIKDLASDSFVEMLVLDGCFIIELFRRCRDYGDNDALLQLVWPTNALFNDLIMMENQIPFFILKHLYVLVDDSASRPHSEECLVEHALKFFFVFFSDNLTMTPEDLEDLENRIRDSVKKILDSEIRIRHLLHLLHSSYIVLIPHEDTKSSEKPRIFCASKLVETGIKFRKRNVSVIDFLDIKFCNGVIEIPRIEVRDKTKIELLKLIAFEQCYPLSKKHITTYAFFMDCLVNTSKDVEILCQKGIIEERLGNEKLVASYFNNIGREALLYYRHFYLSAVCDNINKYRKRPWPNLRASLVHDYFKNPWAIISFLAAVLLLLLTMTQTFFTSFPKFAYGN